MATGIGRVVARSLMLAAVAVFTWAGGIGAQEPFRLTPAARFSLGMEWSYLSFSGDMLVPAGGRPGSGTQVDLASDLGMDLAEASSIRFDATIFDTHRLTAEYLMALPTGLRKAPHAFVFQNRTYAKDARLETRVDLNWLRCAYGYKAVDRGSWWIAPTLAVHYLHCSSTINGDTEEAGVVSNTRTLDGTFPVVGIETRYLFPYGLDMSFELEGIHLFGRGFLTAARVRGQVDLHPDVVASLSLWHRFASRAENTQELNNQWSYSLLGLSGGISFGF